MEVRGWASPDQHSPTFRKPVREGRWSLDAGGVGFEERGVVSIRQRAKIKRNFDPENFKPRPGELPLQENDDENSDSEQLGGESRFAGGRERALVSDPKEPRGNRAEGWSRPRAAGGDAV